MVDCIEICFKQLAFMKTYYDILGVGEQATGPEISKSFHQLAQKYHPDAGGGDEAAVQFKQVNEAYQTLKDEQKRKVYDIFLQRQRGGAPAASSYGSGVSRDESQYRPPSAYQQTGQSPPTASGGGFSSSGRFAKWRTGLKEVFFMLGWAVLGIGLSVGFDFVRRQIIGDTLEVGSQDFVEATALASIMGVLASFSLVEESGLERALRRRFGEGFLFVRSLGACLSGAFLGGIAGDLIHNTVYEGGSFKDMVRGGMLVGAILFGWIAGVERFWHRLLAPGEWFELGFMLFRSLMIVSVFAGMSWIVLYMLEFYSIVEQSQTALFFAILLGSIFGSIAPSDMRAYARYASAYVGRFMVLAIVVLMFVVGVAVGRAGFF